MALEGGAFEIIVPTLHAHSGPVQGRTYTLPEGEFSIGRSSKCHLWLDDPEVSRHHCIVTTSGGISGIRDLESRNQTLVNGEPVRAAQLRMDDEITIGCSVFRYSAEAEESQRPASFGVTLRRPSDSPFLSAVSDGEPSRNTERELKTLLRLSNILHSLHGIAQFGFGADNGPVQAKLEGLLLDLIPAGRAAVLASDTENETVLQACRERTALLTRHPGDTGRNVLAAPIITRSDVPAAIYLESAEHKPFDETHLQFIGAVAEIAAVAWDNAMFVGWLEEEKQRLEHALEIDCGMLGGSTRMRELQQQIARVAGTDATVLVLGETGTGKELVANAIHRNSRRANSPFVAINCASLAENLLESELFGHERGAFTGAVARKRGRMEIADRGTVFLDEIGELALPLQAKLLRVLETRSLERVGGTETIRLDIRIVAATNRNLEDAVRQGTFRQDLYFRLRVVTLRTPPLRETAGDIMLLAEHFAKNDARRCERKLIGISPEARAYLLAYSWPGNVRELKHAIESAVVLGSGEMLLAEDLPEQIRACGPPDLHEGLYAQAVEAAKREVIQRAFAQAGYVHDAAAKLLGLHPIYLHKLMKVLDLKGTMKRKG